MNFCGGQYLRHYNTGYVKLFVLLIVITVLFRPLGFLDYTSRRSAAVTVVEFEGVIPFHCEVIVVVVVFVAFFRFMWSFLFG